MMTATPHNDFICDGCSQVTSTLFEIDDAWLCEDCYETLTTEELENPDCMLEDE